MCRNLTMHVRKIYCDLTNPHGHAFLNTWLTIPGIRTTRRRRRGNST